MRNYKTNSEMKWNFCTDTRIPENIPFVALIEEDTCDPTAYPWTAFLIFKPNNPCGTKIELLDIDLETQEQYLQQYYTIIAWRNITDHGGTWDNFLQDFEFLKDVK